LLPHDFHEGREPRRRLLLAARASPPPLESGCGGL